MIYKFGLGFVLAFLMASFNLPEPGLHFFSGLYDFYPGGFIGIMLLVLRASVGVLFIIHGSPKIINLRAWAESLKMPVGLCFVSALSMILGGICLIVGLLTLLATLPLLCSMGVAIYLHISQHKPFVAKDPYQIPSDEYKGPKGKGEPPSWEKAYMYCIMLLTIAVIGPGAYSVDALIFG
ncbi:MAG: DoxX family protein [Scytonema sp. PMC 1069.18]|nr:DoxX family protein [Scytonema sp. PMC 1069.18]MEC4884764.1 DoxX family protein [Scytonema sp. PMC 1070.18]